MCTPCRHRGKRQTEAELVEARVAVNDMSTINTKAAAEKRSLEGNVHTMQAEIDDMLHQAKGSEEKAKKAMVDAARLADELRSMICFIKPRAARRRPRRQWLMLPALLMN